MLQQTSLVDTDGCDLQWRNLNYDVGWEAAPGGVIRCKSVLNRRRDIFEAVEGASLQSLYCEGQGKTAIELLRDRRQLRHVEVRPPRHFGPDRLYLNGHLLDDGRVVGTFTALNPRFDEAFSGQVALLSQVTQSRSREESFRREAETMLEGLRTLLGQGAALEKLEALAVQIADSIRGMPHQLLRVSRDGVPQLIGEPAPLRGGEAMADFFRDMPSAVTVLREENSCIAALRALLEVGTVPIAVILLPVASGSIALVCAARDSAGFEPRDIEFARRFALILRQALALKDEQDKLMQSAKLSALGQMSASLAHELRQPLNTISITAQNLELMAEDDLLAPEMVKTKITRILAQVERASQIMDRIRRFSRKGGEDLVETDLCQLAEGVRVLMDHLLQPAQVRLEIAVPPGLTVHCDPVKIEQVLVNLVRNAMDALAGIGTKAKTDNGVITIRGEKDAHGVVLRVEDNGPGFPPDVQERPLETFFTTKDADTGTGLGLSICHMIAREHAGKLELGNHDGGAYVALHLPERADD